MKSKYYLLIAILCLSSSKLFSQTTPNFTVQITENSKKTQAMPLYNLYYLSRFISADNLTAEQKETVYSQLFSQIGEQKIQRYYSEAADSSLIKRFLQSYLEKSSHYKDFKDQIQNLSVEVFEKTDYYKNIKGHKALKPIYDNIQKISKELKQQQPVIGKLENVKNDSVTENNKRQIKIDMLSADTMQVNRNEREQLLLLKRSTEFNITKLKEKISILTKAFVDLDAQYNAEIDRLRNEYFLRFTQYKQIIFDSWDFKLSKEAEKNIVNINAIVQTAQKNNSSALNIPSESEFIIAVATVLADRAKQETAIWFMDQVRSRLGNPLVYDAFPETIKLISRLEDYKVPNFSTEWRFAIAKDFVEMPKNIVYSPWVKNIVKNSNNVRNLQSGISFGYDLNRVMTERYNYKDIIRYFYINPRKENSEINLVLNKNITRLYIITNEFFAIDTTSEGEPSYRLLSFEELQSLTDDQWKILFELISLKYKERLDTNDLLTLNDAKSLITKRSEMTKWISNILISLAQFDKINYDHSSAETGNDNLSEQNFYTIWQLIDQIINQLDYSTDSVKSNRELKEDLKKLISIYGDLQSKNFSSAIKKTFDLIDQSTPSKFVTVDSIKLNNKIVLHETFEGSVHKMTLSTDKESINIVNDSNDIVISNKAEAIYRITNVQEIAPAFKFLTSKNDSFDFITEMIAQNDLKKYKKTFEGFSGALGLTDIQMFQLLHYFYLHSDPKLKNPQESIENTLRNFDHIAIGANPIESPIEKYNKRYTSQLLKLSSFFGDILSVKNDKELANVIDSHALPPTSYKLKRKMRSSIDLNAYVGAFGGFMTPSKNSSYSHRMVGGITAPIGIAITSSKKIGFLKNTGITFDAVDLGNIVNHYLVSNTDYSKEVHFSEVFSPGVTLVSGITNSPFVVSAGIKFLPLKTTFIDNQPINDRVFDATIFHLGIKIDIPLINFRSVEK